MTRKKYKPGPGWKRCPNAPVWEHASGAMVHLFGTYMIPTRFLGKTREIPDMELSKYRRICGGRTSRAVMAWVTDNLL